VQLASVGLDGFEDAVGEADDAFAGGIGEGKVDFSVVAYGFDIGGHGFLQLEGTEDFVVVDHAPVAVVDNDAIADVGVFHNKSLYLLAVAVVG